MGAKSFTPAVHTVFPLKNVLHSNLAQAIEHSKGMFPRLYVNDNERRPVPIFGLQILLRIYLEDY